MTVSKRGKAEASVHVIVQPLRYAPPVSESAQPALIAWETLNGRAHKAMERSR